MLLAPLRTDVGYGARKGTGAIGDSLVANRKLLIPAKIELDNEFISSAITYDSAEELCAQFREVVLQSQTFSLDAAVVRHYSSDVAVPRVLGQLGIVMS